MCDRLCSYVNWIEHAPHSIWECYFVIKYIDSGIKTHARKIVCHWFFNIIKYFDTAIGYYIRCWKCQSGELWKFEKSFNSHGAMFGLQYLLFVYIGFARSQFPWWFQFNVINRIYLEHQFNCGKCFSELRYFWLHGMTMSANRIIIKTKLDCNVESLKVRQKKLWLCLLV